jgi:hypothetical protein
MFPEKWKSGRGRTLGVPSSALGLLRSECMVASWHCLFSGAGPGSRLEACFQIVLWHRFPGRPASEFGRLNETASRWREVKQPID